jgi:hypothetical protein
MAQDHEYTRKTLTDHNEAERSRLNFEKEELRSNLTGQMESNRQAHLREHESTRTTLTTEMETMRRTKDMQFSDLNNQHEDLRLKTRE